jgi:hypothetical protein
MTGEATSHGMFFGGIIAQKIHGDCHTMVAFQPIKNAWIYPSKMGWKAKN